MSVLMSVGVQNVKKWEGKKKEIACEEGTGRTRTRWLLECKSRLLCMSTTLWMAPAHHTSRTWTNQPARPLCPAAANQLDIPSVRRGPSHGSMKCWLFAEVWCTNITLAVKSYQYIVRSLKYEERSSRGGLKSESDLTVPYQSRIW